MCGSVLPVVVTTIENLRAAFDSAFVLLDAKMNALMALEMLWPLESAGASVPVTIFPLDSRTANRFPLASDGVKLVTFNVDVAIMRTPHDEL